MNNKKNFFKSFCKSLVSNIGVKIIALIAAFLIFVVVHAIS